MNVNEYIKYDGTGLAELVKQKEVTKEELIETSFKQLARVGKDINAVAYTRKEKALEEASSKVENRPFEGVPIYLKDLAQSIEGEPSTGSAKLLRNERARFTTNFVRSLYDAGFISLGKSTIPEFSIKNITEPKMYGPTRNPWNLNYSPGGSSGGAAALVAAGVVPVSGANDGGGSIRIPASFCGLFGVKPTRGRITVGPTNGRQGHGAAVSFVLTKSVRDAALALTSLQTIQEEAAFQTSLFPGRYEEAMKEKSNRTWKIGFTVDSPVGTTVSEEAKRAVKKVVTYLESQGHKIEEVQPEVDGIQLIRNYYLMNSVGIASFMRQLEKKYQRSLTADDMEIETWVLYQAGKHVKGVDFSESLASWDEAAAQMAKYHDTYDFYITPTTAFPAPRIGQFTPDENRINWLKEQIAKAETPQEQQDVIYDMFLASLEYTPFTQLANLTGQPAATVPVHLTGEGLPLGVQLIARKGEESKILQLAYELEQSALWVGLKGNPYFDEA